MSTAVIHPNWPSRRHFLHATGFASAATLAGLHQSISADSPPVNPPARSPDRVTPLFNGRDLTGL